MRQGQQNRRGRGRTNNNNNTNNHNGGNGGHSNHGRKPQNPLSRNYESSGPDVKIRGTAAQIAEKYMTLARDASSAGDVVTAENYLQHAEHYNRIIMAAQQAQVATQPSQGAEPINGFNGHHHRPQPESANNYAMRDQPQPVVEQQPPQSQPTVTVPGAEPQPEVVAEPVANGAHTEAAEPAPARPAPEADARRRRRRYPSGGAASRASATSEPTAANGHNGSGGNSLDSEPPPSDEALAN